MADATSQTHFHRLRSNLPENEQAENLRDIKNYIAGHELRKRQYVQDGLIAGLAAVVGKITTRGTGNRGAASYNETIWNQVANITCVLAHGGPTFVHSILDSKLLSSLVLRLSVDLQTKPSLVILNALNTIADNLPLSAPNTWNFDRRLAECLYSGKNSIDFVRLLSSEPESDVSDQIFEATAALICKTCTAEHHKAALVEGGVLAILCKRLISFVALQGLIIPHQSGHGPDQSRPNFLTQLVTSTGQPSSTLETIALLIEGSKEHSLRFLQDPLIVQVLPNDAVVTTPSDGQDTAWISQNQPLSLTPLDAFLPSVPDNATGNAKEISSFPPLGTAMPAARKRQSSTRLTASPSSVMPVEQATGERSEYLIVPWLLYIVRTSRGKTRLVASRLLAILHAHGLVKPSRARTFGTLLVPILIRMLDDQKLSNTDSPFLLTRMHYSQAVPAVLASLIQDDSEMQRIAFEAKAIPRLAVALKSTFEHADDRQIHLWIPTRLNNLSTPTATSADGSRWGGPLLEARHIMSFREGLLRALAAIAPFDDTYRKEICDQGALVQIMLALEPFQNQDASTRSNSRPTLNSGNSTSTLLAACNAVRALTRSVTALRTKLVDADVGKAIIKLMYNPDPEVRIAATKVIANLAMDFSPLKATISEPDLVKKLCEQAHSANARLRLESVWALKLLVLDAPNKLKRDVIDELGSKWIKHLIETDPYNIPPGIVIGLSERDYPPRTTRDTESAYDDMIIDEDVDTESSVIGVIPSPYDPAENYNKHSVEDDLAIQEQLIDLIRNLFCGETASEVVDYLLGEIGTDIFMKVLVDRLKPRLTTSATIHAGTKSSKYRGIIVKVLYVIVHIAACAPKFRNMIATNSALMRSIAGFCTHDDPEIRVQCCWIIINLTYEDDLSDREACRIRAREIQKAGFQGHMRRLESDPEPNVRERAKTAVHLLLKIM